jgi:hypothetical protein
MSIEQLISGLSIEIARIEEAHARFSNIYKFEPSYFIEPYIRYLYKGSYHKNAQYILIKNFKELNSYHGDILTALTLALGIGTERIDTGVLYDIDYIKCWKNLTHEAKELVLSAISKFKNTLEVSGSLDNSQLLESKINSDDEVARESLNLITDHYKEVFCLYANSGFKTFKIDVADAKLIALTPSNVSLEEFPLEDSVFYAIDDVCKLPSTFIVQLGALGILYLPKEDYRNLELGEGAQCLYGIYGNWYMSPSKYRIAYNYKTNYINLIEMK